MTRWSQSKSTRLIPLIVQHLCILEHHNSVALSPIMRDICIGIQDKWLALNAAPGRDKVDHFEDAQRRRNTSLH